ncbi:MazG family protein [Dictyobacter alpinus]|uniref:MazG family protein n=1 Tax=Dictyobacter alpinus TaxID=2014873 RepID=A0A402BI38_9CHLR|nr:nucleoside triphosphate pyrophosphohydrolase family protein [Dictyobacter alpinus]GCE31068.1 MazG family protein [Dictyobacter alpinus]
MDIATYAKEVQRTCDIKDQRERLILSALGIAGEGGEIVDLLKKSLYHSHDLDTSDLCKELGDLLWYMTLLSESVGLTLEDIMQANVTKLRQRYPDGFDPQRSKNREE